MSTLYLASLLSIVALLWLSIANLLYNVLVAS